MKRLILCQAFAALVFVLTACGTTKTSFIQEPLPIPDRPDVPTISPGDLSCVPDDAYFNLVARDQMQFEHIKRLEAIIRTTHKE